MMVLAHLQHLVPAMLTSEFEKLFLFAFDDQHGVVFLRKEQLGLVVRDPHRPLQAAPCKGCPFRRDSAPGWLGAASPAGFVASVLAEEPLPCHQTIDYAQPDWEAHWRGRQIGKLCRGALVFARNIGKRARNQTAQPTVPGDVVTVFEFSQEFVSYHASALVRSWEDET